ncbi:MAG: pimeloyl-ACP methyl ester carboxylesterase [Paraglaciecola sp.]|jgi:pimeloyl-ACP methyl ester carboxylesterase
MTPVEHHYAQINGHTVHYVEAGPSEIPMQGKAKTLIFFHGFPEYWGSWQQQIDYFSRQYRVIVPDLIGYNTSDKPTELSFYQLPNLISFYADFIRQVSAQTQVSLIAHDWGGAIAWPLAAFHRTLFDKLVILNAAHPSTFTREMINNPEQRKKSAYIHQLISPNAEQLLIENNYAFLREMLFEQIQGIQLSAQWKNAYIEAWKKPGAIQGMLNYYRSMPQLASNEEIDVRDNDSVKAVSQMKIPNIRIDLPTLILWGEQDEAFVSNILDNIETYVVDCEIVRFPQASHWLHHEQSDTVNKNIALFLEKV